MTSVGYHGHCHTSRLAVVLVLALAVEVVVVVAAKATVAELVVVVEVVIVVVLAAVFSLFDTNIGCQTVKSTSMQQVLLTLRFCATASFHQVIGDLIGMSNYAVCKVKHRVSRAISKNKRQFISFPVDFHETKRSFYDVAGFSWVFGAID